MSPDTLFTLCNTAVIPAWLLLTLAPRFRLTQFIVHAIWVPLLLGPVYVWALFFGPPVAEGAGFSSLQGVVLLFQSPTAVLGGWIHYLVFDLFVGAWIVRDAQRQQINHWLTVSVPTHDADGGPSGSDGLSVAAVGHEANMESERNRLTYMFACAME